MTKYYRVKKDNFMWKEGAILSSSAQGGGYQPLEDIWNNTPVNETEYISARVVEHENNSDNFERVYKDTVTGALFRTADQIKHMYQDSFK